METAVNYDFTRSKLAPAIEGRDAPEAACVTVDMDTVQAAEMLCQYGHCPAVLNFAAGTNCGGAFDHGRGSQEEDVFRKTSLVMSLWPHRSVREPHSRRGRWIGTFDDQLERKEAWYPHTECGGIYSPHVRAIMMSGRLPPLEDFNRCPSFAVLTVAAQNVRKSPPFDEPLLFEKCRTVLWMAAKGGHDVVVLGAFGCGYFGNPTRAVVDAFARLLGHSGEFSSAFKLVVFAVPSNHGSAHFKAFAQRFPVSTAMQAIVTSIDQTRMPSPEVDCRIANTSDVSAVDCVASSEQCAKRPFEVVPSEEEANIAVHAGGSSEDCLKNTILSMGGPVHIPCEQLQQSCTEPTHECSSDLASLEVEDKVSLVLDSLPAGSRVALVTMVGSLCPVTLGHVGSFIEARRILLGLDGVPRPARLEQFDACIGFFRLNSDGHVQMKMKQKGDHPLRAMERGHCIKLATRTHDWLGLSVRTRGQEEMVRQWPNLQFVKFSLNGADDVARYQKWGQATRTHRLITMGRPGNTEKVMAGMKKAKINPDDGFFIMGPELPDISSTRLRGLLQSGRSSAEELGDLVDVAVGRWCIQKWRKEGWSDIVKVS